VNLLTIVEIRPLCARTAYSDALKPVVAGVLIPEGCEPLARGREALPRGWMRRRKTIPEGLQKQGVWGQALDTAVQAEVTSEGWGGKVTWMRLRGWSMNLLGWWAGSLLLWGLVTLAFAAQLVLAAEVEWWVALQIAMREWAPWALLTPLVAGLTVRFPFERGRWPLSLAVHGLACGAVILVVGMLSQAWASGAMDLPGPSLRRPPGGFEGGPRPGGRPENRPPGGPPGVRRDRPPPGAGRGPMLGRLRLHVPVYWIVVSVTSAVLHARRAQERERRSLELAHSLAQARLSALRMQLQPHFLFNALNAISSLVHSNPEAADEMIANLSDFLRMTLELPDHPQVPLRRELEFLDRYLAIEQVRFGGRLRVTRDFPADTLDVPVPVLVLQPLVENAVRHGLQPRPGPGQLRISARRTGDVLEVAVVDDGVGIGVGMREGIGLSNTRARLRELHGDGARLEIGPAPGQGTVVTLRVPIASLLTSPATDA